MASDRRGPRRERRECAHGAFHSRSLALSFLPSLSLSLSLSLSPSLSLSLSLSPPLSLSVLKAPHAASPAVLRRPPKSSLHTYIRT